MKANAAQHDRQVWERFWDDAKPIGEVYANSGRIVEQILQLGPVGGKIILEVGAGSGRDGLHLAQQGGRIVFLDYAVNSLRVIQKTALAAGHPVLLVRGDAFRLPFKSNSIDLVYHQGLLEHFTAPLGIVRENERVLRVGGRAIADVPHRYHVYTVVKHILIRMNKWFAGWETEFTRPQLESLFRQAGLTPDRFYGDWMRPSFGYRVLRELVKKVGIRLPLYPKPIPFLHPLRKALARRFSQSTISRYTYMDIGVIGKKGL
jgi:ubiquinone/menaquinone biosynthesis C-methylase UbiE